MAGEDWTDEEVRICVEAYFEHLVLDVSGRQFNKAKLYREIAERIPRTPSSVEFKFQNVSAVLDELGTEWIRGLAPLGNYQKALAEAVEQNLPQFLKREIPPQVSGLRDLVGLYVEPAPERVVRKKSLPDYIERLVRKFDPVERDIKNRAIGMAGEELTLNFERRSLVAYQRDDLAKKVRWVSKEDGDGAGFDILSFDPDGREKFIEVKTTIGGSRTPFYISRNENDFSKEAGDHYRLFRLYDFRRKPRAFELVGAVDQYVRLSPEAYRADFILNTD